MPTMAFAAGGNKTETPALLSYANVMSQDTMRIALTLAALNILGIKSCDIKNAYLMAPNREHIWACLGPEWGDL